MKSSSITRGIENWSTEYHLLGDKRTLIYYSTTKIVIAIAVTHLDQAADIRQKASVADKDDSITKFPTAMQGNKSGREAFSYKFRRAFCSSERRPIRQCRILSPATPAGSGLKNNAVEKVQHCQITVDPTNTESDGQQPCHCSDYS